MKLKNKLRNKHTGFLKNGRHFLIALAFGFVVTACQDVKRPQMPANLIAQDYFPTKQNRKTHLSMQYRQSHAPNGGLSSTTLINELP